MLLFVLNFYSNKLDGHYSVCQVTPLICFCLDLYLKSRTLCQQYTPFWTLSTNIIVQYVSKFLHILKLPTYRLQINRTELHKSVRLKRCGAISTGVLVPRPVRRRGCDTACPYTQTSNKTSLLRSFTSTSENTRTFGPQRIQFIL